MTIFIARPSKHRKTESKRGLTFHFFAIDESITNNPAEAVEVAEAVYNHRRPNNPAAVEVVASSAYACASAVEVAVAEVVRSLVAEAVLPNRAAEAVVVVHKVRYSRRRLSL